MKQTIWFITDVARAMGLSESSIRRYVSELRQGRGNNVPCPISPPGAKLRWLASDVTAFLQTQSSRSPPITPTIVPQLREERKSSEARNAAAKATLMKHAVGRRTQR